MGKASNHITISLAQSGHQGLQYRLPKISKLQRGSRWDLLPTLIRPQTPQNCSLTVCTSQLCLCICNTLLGCSLPSVCHLAVVLSLSWLCTWVVVAHLNINIISHAKEKASTAKQRRLGTLLGFKINVHRKDISCLAIFLELNLYYVLISSFWHHPGHIVQLVPCRSITKD